MTPALGCARPLTAARRRPAGAERRSRSAFSLLELLLALAAVAILAAIAVPAYSGYRDRMNVDTAIADIRRIELEIERYRTVHFRLPESLADVRLETLHDPWGRPYAYLNLQTALGRGAMRKDRNLVPINSDFDLYSLGKDGRSRPPLGARASLDDIVRANNGGFVGLAKDY